MKSLKKAVEANKDPSVYYKLEIVNADGGYCQIKSPKLLEGANEYI